MKKIILATIGLVTMTHCFASEQEERQPQEDTAFCFYDLLAASESGKSLDAYYINMATNGHLKNNIKILGTLLAAGHHNRCGKASLLNILNIFMIQQITELAALANLSNTEKNKALIEAVKIGNPDYVSNLLSFGANIETESKNEQIRPLHAACQHGYTEIARLLLQHGADKNAAVADIDDLLSKGTPLHFAAAHSNDECVKLLIDAGANVNAVNTNKYTPLHYASWAGSAKCVGLLLAAGADKNMLSVEGSTALSIAEKSANPDCMNLLR